MTSAPQSHHGPPAAGARLPNTRARLFGLSVIWLIAITVAMASQRPSSDPLAPPARWTSLEWWTHPLERNALLRMQSAGHIRDITGRPTSEELFAVGDGGIVLRSRDRGATWERRPVEWTPAPAPVTPPPAAAASAEPPAASDVERVAFVQEAAAPSAPTGLRIVGSKDDATTNSASKSPSQTAPIRDREDSIADDLGTRQSKAPEPERKDTAPVGPAEQSQRPTFDDTIGPPVGQGVVVPNSDLRAVAFGSGERGWAVGDNGTVLQTEDGGETWRVIAPRVADSFIAVASVDGTTHCAFPAEGFIACANERTQWRMLLPGATGMQVAAVTADATRMWVLLLPSAAPTRRIVPDATVLSGDGESWSIVDDDSAFGDVRASRDRASIWYLDPSADGGTQGIGQLVPPAVDAIERTGAVPVTIDRVAPLDATRAWGIGADGSVLFTADGGEQWQTAAPDARDQPPISVRRIWPLDSEQAVVGDEDGGLFVVSRGGGWRRATSPQINKATMFADRRTGWAVGSQGTIVTTIDGGTSWDVVHSGVSQNLRDVAFATDGRRGWVVGDRLVLRTTDGGATWSRWDLPPERLERLVGLRMQADGRTGYLLDAAGGVIRTADAGGTWTAASRPDDITGLTPPAANGSVAAIARAPNGDVWEVGPRGVIRNGAGPSSIPADTTGLTAIAFSADGTRVWIAGRGAVLSSTNAHQPSASWVRSSVAMASAWRQIVPFPTGSGALALGAGATMYRSDDGDRWTPIAYRQYPAPWYYLAFLIGIAPIAYLVAKKPAPDVSPAPSVADVFVSDRPLERGDADALSHGHLAAGLARFLANEKTEPPLTIAITGEWGTGKTSMMNIARDMLTSFGFRTVWFNAWHHQTEEHLLGALLESLRRDALPPWWSLRGLRVRIRLLGLRGMRQWGPAALLIGACGAAAGYFLREPAETLDEARQWIVALFTGATPIPADILDVLAVLGTAGGVVPLLKSMQTWGLSAPKLKTALSAYDPLSELKLPTGFRHRFADIFSDITRALQPQQLVIFVDDLDRCQPESVVATLEMINFLVSSGRCIVVLGMARERVERCVGLGFKDLAELATDGAADGAAATDAAKRDANERRDEFARQYLEKLVNIELPIPMSDPSASRQLVTGAVYDQARVSKARQRNWDTAMGWAGVALAAAVAVLGYWAGTSMHGNGTAVGPVVATASPAATPVPTPAQASATPSPVGGPATLDTAAGAETQAAAAIRQPTQIDFLEAASDEPPWMPATLLILAAFVAGLLGVAMPRVHVEHDSSEFVASLNRWFGGVHAKSPTPRAIKRFLNRLRFYAMEQRKTTAPQSAWDRLLRRPIREIASPVAMIPERTLVALSVLQHARGDRDLTTADIAEARAAHLKGPLSSEDRLKLEDLEGAEACLGAFLYLARGSRIRR